MYRGGVLGRNVRAAQEKKAAENRAKRLQFLKEQLDAFKESMKKFAIEHKDEIAKRPEFRLKFHNLCRSVGIDPLTSSKGMWAELLGIGDFYYELSVQIVDVCISTRNHNGGIIEISELKRRVEDLRNQKNSISNDDIVRAIGKLNILRSGFCVHRIGKQTLIHTVPNELNMDQKLILELAQRNCGRFTKKTAIQQLKWDEERIDRSLGDMMKEGTVMIDEQSPTGEMLYWVVGLLRMGLDGTLEIGEETVSSDEGYEQERASSSSTPSSSSSSSSSSPSTSPSASMSASSSSSAIRRTPPPPPPRKRTT
ncbi:Vacuolar protein sorting 22 (Vps22) [Monocercomonoides exilis]|uniref:Vacuolar protein sorting 22 (Vps22) n=1 Tax=Monocercomonoides exilis TaxID=2049356 RepID=UPI00355A1194|nr:Vacuolar protein sorting 22 (Vps22) [Monocercomonoides exilis]|eukprot:MONOS_14227.1-p1 / transcript=MONOS_14227.1 / gene=MONOS_14227 / organism=Monocercomonoides_exilis_PA203 / gene_product= Vacuolar protein sorting 22 (Vps22) / transcript_product= Vacuolar protein sorting 22 (Vps22) / location=Mono_scaffold00959:20946-22002(-) / protein_length=310 / sequence_SO=supercontig / SO=protein_coding / is_pseudo=false